MGYFVRAGAAFAGVSVLALASSANAQATAIAPSQAPSGAQTGDASATQGADVVVTGSRVIRNGNNSPTPVTVVSVEDVLRSRPTTVADALNELPVFSGSRGQLSNPSASTGTNTGGGNSAGNNLNLRNMGAVRTLILFDGHRVPSTNVNGIIDVDMIPQQLLQRVDVVTGGASAVYGSDAMTGVVNFITDRHFNGLKLNAEAGVTQMGDDPSQNIGVAWGSDLFGGKGHLELSYEYRNDAGIDRRSSRDPDHDTYTVQGAGSVTNPYYLTPDARVTSATFGGLITGKSVLAGMTFDQNGVLNPFVAGAPSGSAGLQIGGDGFYYDSSLKSSLRSHQAFGRFDYDFTPSVHGYVEGAFNDKQNVSYVNWLNLNNVVLSATDPYLASQYQSELTGAGQSTFTLSKQMMDAPRLEPIVDSRQIFVNAGLDGGLGGSWKWDVGYVHSSSTMDQENPTNINYGRLYASLDAVRNGSGQIVCNASLGNAAAYGGCVPLNPFGPTSDSAEALGYILGTTHFIAHTHIDDVTGSVSGSPFSTWAGPVTVAFSGEWRRIGYNATSDAQPTDLLNCAGLRYNCTSTTTVWATNIAARSPVEQTVREGAVEVELPLLKDSVIARSFALNGAVRYTSYDTSGTYWPWKIGFDWHLTEDLRFRGTRSRDIRAPTLDDLYSPTSQTVTTFADLLTQTNPSKVVITSGGNPNLTAEQGDTWTVGAVYRPHWFPNFSLSVDYYDINVTNAILSIVAQQPLFQLACNNSGGTSPYCALYDRPNGFTDTSPSNAVTAVHNTVINIAQQKTNGVDVEANYGTKLFSRPASIRLLATYQPHLKYIQPGLPTVDQAGVAFGNNGTQAVPVWRATAFVRFSPLRNIDIDIENRWRSSLKLSGDPTLLAIGPRVKSTDYTDLNLAYTIPDARLGRMEFFVNVSNLFNEGAPPAAFYASQNNPGLSQGFVIGDDPIGRAFIFGVRLRR
jgi:outer membrane receptor protein involved in Fe transport